MIAACKAVNLNVPLVVRMKGTNEDLGKKMLAESGLPIIAADTMAEAATVAEGNRKAGAAAEAQAGGLAAAGVAALARRDAATATDA